MSGVVVGYVARPEGDAALDRAVEEARLREQRVVVILSHRGGPEFDRDEAARSEQEAADLRSRLEGAGVPFEIRQLVRGMEPAEDLIKAAEEHDADLIVIGLRRRSPIGKLILGSNAQRVLLDSRCAVLAVKAEAAPAEPSGEQPSATS